MFNDDKKQVEQHKFRKKLNSQLICEKNKK
jgi:hypothetical protein